MSSLLKRRSVKSAPSRSRTRSGTPSDEQLQVTSSRSTGFLSSLRPRSAEASPDAKDGGRSFSWSQTYARIDPQEFMDEQDNTGGAGGRRLSLHNATPAFASSGRFGSFSGIVDKDTTSLHSIEDLALHRPAPHQTSECNDATPEIAPRRSSIASTRPPPVEVTIEVSKEQLKHSRHASVESTLEEQGARFNATPSPPALPFAPNGNGPHHPYVFRLTPPSGERGEAMYLSEYATVDGDEDVQEVLMHPRFWPSDAGELSVAHVLYASLADLLLAAGLGRETTPYTTVSLKSQYEWSPKQTRDILEQWLLVAMLLAGSSSSALSLYAKAEPESAAMTLAYRIATGSAYASLSVSIFAALLAAALMVADVSLQMPSDLARKSRWGRILGKWRVTKGHHHGSQDGKGTSKSKESGTELLTKAEQGGSAQPEDRQIVANEYAPSAPAHHLNTISAAILDRLATLCGWLVLQAAMLQLVGLTAYAGDTGFAWAIWISVGGCVAATLFATIAGWRKGRLRIARHDMGSRTMLKGKREGENKENLPFTREGAANGLSREDLPPGNVVGDSDEGDRVRRAQAHDVLAGLPNQHDRFGLGGRNATRTRAGHFRRDSDGMPFL